jgi:WD40 repeat protein
VHGICARVSAIAFGGVDDRLLAIGDTSGKLRVWDTQSNSGLFEVPPQPSAITALAFPGDGRRVLIGGANGEIRVFQVLSGREVLALKGHAANITSIAFSPGEISMISASADGVVQT